MYATEQGTVVSQIAPAECHRSVNGRLLVVMVAVVVAAHAPRVAADDAVQALNGVDNGCRRLTQESGEALGAVVKHRQAQAVRHFTNGHAAATGGNDVVDGRRLRLAQELPHQRAAQGVGCRLPEGQPVRACRIKVEVTVVRVCKHVGDEEVVVPHHAVGEVPFQRAQRGLRELLFQHVTVKEMHAHVDASHLGSGLPVAFLHGQCHRRVCGHKRLPLLVPGALPRVVLVACLAQRHAQLHQRTVAVGLVAVVVSSQSPAHRGKGPYPFGYLVVGIHACLQRVEPLRRLVRVLLEGLHMVEAHITAQTPLGRQLPVLSQSVEQRSRELRVEAHEVRTYANDVVGALVAETHGTIDLR